MLALAIGEQLSNHVLTIVDTDIQVSRQRQRNEVGLDRRRAQLAWSRCPGAWKRALTEVEETSRFAHRDLTDLLRYRTQSPPTKQHQVILDVAIHVLHVRLVTVGHGWAQSPTSVGTGDPQYVQQTQSN